VRRVTILVLTGALAACVGPRYERPELDIPQQYRFEAAGVPGATDSNWWTAFGDPVLDELVAEALANNEDLRIAAARVDQFQAARVQARAAWFPSIGYTGTTGRESRSELVYGPGADEARNFSSAGLTAGWEIDVWGRVRNLAAAAEADWRVSEADRRATALALVSNVISGYLTLRSLDDQLEIAQRTLEGRRDALEVFEKRHRRGVISGVELSQARSQYELAAAAVPQLRLLVARQENALSLLAGRNPGPVARGSRLAELSAPAIPAGLPSEILEQRPDVVAVEQQLVAANARLGAARALYFPTISLTGLLGVASLDLDALFDTGSDTWNYAGTVTGPLFQGGAVVATNRQAEAQRRQLVAAYEKTVQRAFADVDDALAAVDNLTERTAAQARQVDALGSYARLARKRYEGGYAGYLEVLDAEASFFNAELSYSQGLSERLSAYVDLYKALGGGWVDVALEGAPRPESAPGG